MEAEALELRSGPALFLDMVLGGHCPALSGGGETMPRQWAGK